MEIQRNNDRSSSSKQLKNFNSNRSELLEDNF